VQPSTTDHQTAVADYRPAGQAIPHPAVRSSRDGATNTVSDEQVGRVRTYIYGTMNQRGPPTHVVRQDSGRTAIWRGGLQYENAVSECSNPGSQGRTSCAPSPGRQRPVMFRLPGLSSIGSNSAERLHCLTQDGHTTHNPQRTRRTVEDAVCIQRPEVRSLRPDLATLPGGRNDWAGGSTRVYIAPRSSFSGP